MEKARQVSDRPPSNETCRPETDGEATVTLGQRIDRIYEAAQATWKGGSDTVRECRAALDIDRRVQRNPYAMMAAAMGSGYVLGGGLSSPLTTHIVGVGLRLGLRFAALPFIERELLARVESATPDAKASGLASRQPQQTQTKGDPSCPNPKSPT